MIADAVKAIARLALEASPARLLYGEVTGVSPLTVRLSQRLTLREEELIVPDYLERLLLKTTEDGEIKEYELIPPLKKGDAVILCNLEQQYLLIGKGGAADGERIAAAR